MIPQTPPRCARRSKPTPAPADVVRPQIVPGLVELLRQCATRGDANAQAQLGLLYYEDKHLPIPESLSKNIEYDWYESGHMVYVRDESLQQLHDRVATFIRSTEAGNR